MGAENLYDAVYDVIVIGGGPAGYTAALYAVRAGLSTLVLEKLAAGGQMALTTQIDNYPGFDQGIDGFTLGERMRKGAERFGAKTVMADAAAADLAGGVKSVTTAEGVFRSRTVIIATGAAHKHLGLPGEQQLVGRGVGYCAACDGMLYKGKTVAVIGGGNSAAADALLLSKICKEVILIHRRDALRATKVYHDPLMRAPHVRFVMNSTVTELIAQEKLTGLRIKNVDGKETTLPVDGAFISIGRAPETAPFRGALSLDASGYVPADESTRTELPGVFAAGDVRRKPLRQIVTAVADGAVAAQEAELYLAQAHHGA